MVNPKFTLVAVSTLDGRIARHSRHMSNWSSKEDKREMHKLLDKCDVVIVGRNTYTTAKKPLSGRNCIVFTRSVKNPVRKAQNLVLLNPNHSGVRQFCLKNGYRKVCVLGGTKTFSYFLAEGLVHEIFLTIEPLAFGSGLPLFDAGKKDVVFALVSAKRLNRQGALLLRYRAGR